MFRIVKIVRGHVANLAHVLPACVSFQALLVKGDGSMGSHVDLLVGPAVHAQGLDLGNVRAQLSMDRSTSHAEEDTQLSALLV